MNALGCLLGFFFGIILLFLNAILKLWWNVRRTMKSMGGMNGGSGAAHGAYSGQQQTKAKTKKGARSEKKVFGDDEGEYVDYEEV